MKIKLVFVSLLAVTVSLFSGFFHLVLSSGSDGGETDNLLRLGLNVSGMGKLDPHFAAGSQDRVFADMVFNGLLRYKPGEAPTIEPDLAESLPEFEMVGKKQVWTISLKKGVMFHSAPGMASYEMSADDVVYSLQKSSDPNFSAYAGEYADWEVKAAGRYSIRITLKQPVSSVLFLPKLTNYAGGFIVSKKAIETWGYDEFGKRPIGTGPFKFHSYERGKKLTLRANSNYFRGKPLLAGVEIHFYPNLADREKRFFQGHLDVITGSGAKGWIEKTAKIGGVIVDTFGVGEVSALYFNSASAPLDDIRVRRAIAYALDRGAFLNTTSKEIAEKVFSPVPEMFLPGGLNKEEVDGLGLAYQKNINKAKKLMAEAGYAKGFTLDLVASEKRIYRSLYKVLQKELSQVGITCKITEVNHSEMHRQIRKNPKSIVIYAAWRPNADAYLTRFFHSDSTVVTGEKPDTNFSHYGAIDKLIEDARLEIYPERQINLWKQAQIRILSDMVAYPLLFTRQMFARKNNVDYGHSLGATMALYPQITEKTRL